MNGDNTAWVSCTIYASVAPEEVYIVMDEYGFAMYDFYETTNSNAIARGVSAKQLAKWAFAHGAHTVRHDYDLRFEK